MTNTECCTPGNEVDFIKNMTTAELVDMHLYTAKNIKLWITANPANDSEYARLKIADYVHMARLFNHKLLRERRAA